MKIEIVPFPVRDAEVYVKSSNPQMPPSLATWTEALKRGFNPKSHKGWDKAKTIFYKNYNHRPNRNLDTNFSRKPIKLLLPWLSTIHSLLLVGAGQVTGNSTDHLILQMLRQPFTVSSLDPYVTPIHRSITHINQSITDPVSREHSNHFDATLFLGSGLMDVYPHLFIHALTSLRDYTRTGGLVAIDINATYTNEPIVFDRIWKYPCHKPITGTFFNVSPLMLKTLMKANDLVLEGDYPYVSPDLTLHNIPNYRYLGIWKKLPPTA